MSRLEKMDMVDLYIDAAMASGCTPQPPFVPEAAEDAQWLATLLQKKGVYVEWRGRGRLSFRLRNVWISLVRLFKPYPHMEATK